MNKATLFIQAHKYARELRKFDSASTYRELFSKALKQGYKTFGKRNAWGTSLAYRNFWEADKKDDYKPGKNPFNTEYKAIDFAML